MSLFEFMTWAEVARGNDLLEEQNATIEQMRSEQIAESDRRREHERDRTLVSAFEKLYKSGGDVDVVQMHQIIELKTFIYNRFRSSTSRYYRDNYPKPEYKRRILGAVISLTIAIYMAPRLLPYNIITWIVFGIVSFFFLNAVSQMISDNSRAKENIRRQKKYEEEAAKAAKMLKIQFPKLTAYGVYLKWYLDMRILATADALAPLYPQYNQYQIIRTFYKLFDLDSSAFRHYNGKYINRMDGFFVEAFKGEEQ